MPPQDQLPCAFSPPDHSFEGIAFTGVVPPDTVGDVGPNDYVQMVNGPTGSRLMVYDKSGNPRLLAPVELDSMFPCCLPCAFGGGDPIVAYDKLADRWVLSEVASPFGPFPGAHDFCVYVSRTGDPTSGGWYNYDFPSRDIPDYQKLAVWPDAYYVAAREAPLAAYALDRAAMLTGDTATALATMQRQTVPFLPNGIFTSLTPSDLDGATPPPVGEPNFFARIRDDEVYGPGTTARDYLEIWEYHVDWGPPAVSTITGPINVALPEFDVQFCAAPDTCFAQPSGPGLDTNSDHLMWRLQYRNFKRYESLLGSFVTDVDGTDHGGVRWIELRRTPPGSGAWALFQSGTVAPDSDNRWCSSIAMDGCGDIAVGYSVSGTSTYPGIRYTGRLASDAAGVMQAESTLKSGGGSQNQPPAFAYRWGDYSAPLCQGSCRRLMDPCGGSRGSWESWKPLWVFHFSTARSAAENSGRETNPDDAIHGVLPNEDRAEVDAAEWTDAARRVA